MPADEFNNLVAQTLDRLDTAFQGLKLSNPNKVKVSMDKGSNSYEVEVQKYGIYKFSCDPDQ